MLMATGFVEVIKVEEHYFIVMVLIVIIIVIIAIIAIIMAMMVIIVVKVFQFKCQEVIQKYY